MFLVVAALASWRYTNVYVAGGSYFPRSSVCLVGVRPAHACVGGVWLSSAWGNYLGRVNKTTQCHRRDHRRWFPWFERERVRLGVLAKMGCLPEKLA